MPSEFGEGRVHEFVVNRRSSWTAAGFWGERSSCSAGWRGPRCVWEGQYSIFRLFGYVGNPLYVYWLCIFLLAGGASRDYQKHSRVL